MAYTALYRQYRPRVFDDIVEQHHVVRTLKNSIQTGHIAHAYLFCGTRGTGKTSTAHILARAVNCLEPQEGNPCNSCEICSGIMSEGILDVLELDAASNNSVDNIRDIRDEVAYSPTHAKYKVYIIDEVHMLSSGAFNALLKTLEEPPSHVIFILATTEPHRLPATILSRCQRYDFHRISIKGIVGRLSAVCTENSVSAEPQALKLISAKADGALRDALSILDQCVSAGYEKITPDSVLSITGAVDYSFLSSLASYISKSDVKGVLDSIHSLYMEGRDIRYFTSDLIAYYRNILVYKITGSDSYIEHFPSDVRNKIKSLSGATPKDELTSAIRELSSLEAELKWAGNRRILLEVTLIKLCEGIAPEKGTLSERITALEKRIESLSAHRIQPVRNKVSEAAPLKKEQESCKYTPGPSAPHTGGKPLECWRKILDALKSEGKMALYANLLDAKAYERDGVVELNLNSMAFQTITKQENTTHLEKLLSNELKKQIKIKAVKPSTQSNKDNVDKGEQLIEKGRQLAEQFGVPLEVIDE